MELILLVLLAFLGSSVITVLVTKTFDRGKDKATTSDILSQAWERSLKTMANQLAAQQQQIERQADRIRQLEKDLTDAYRVIQDLNNHISNLEKLVANYTKEGK